MLIVYYKSTALCRNTNEARIFLRKKSGYTGFSNLPYPRLLLAMDLNQKEFVAHPHVQDVRTTKRTCSY